MVVRRGWRRSRFNPIATMPAILVAVIMFPVAASGFVPYDRWSTSAFGPAGGMGDPVTLTWSIVPDGTAIPGETPSRFISFLDASLGAGLGGSDLTLRPWFAHLSDAFDRWSELSGVTFVYEPHDDGLSHGGFSGQLGIRGDIRLGAAPIDGAGNTLAYSYYPDSSDMVLDADDASFFSNASSTYRRLRNTLMHELGHGLGLQHVESSNAAFLLEPSINVLFDGPQLDDIRGAHWYYGDALEKANGGLGNGMASRATSLGTLVAGSPLAIGIDSGPDTVVSGTDTDFVSIANSSDADYYSFSVLQSASVNLLLTPRGGIFNQGVQGGEQSLFDANARSNLTLTVFNTDGASLLAFADDQIAGAVESLTSVVLPAAGQYFARVTGSTEIVQLYQLEISAVAPLMLLEGDYNSDGMVDAADFTVWRDSLGQSGSGLEADGNEDGVIGQDDYDVWRTNFGNIAGSGSGIEPRGVPEPVSVVMVLLGWLPVTMSRRRWRGKMS